MSSFSSYSALSGSVSPASIIGFSAAMALRNIAHAQRHIALPANGESPAWVTHAIATLVVLADTLGEVLYASGGDARRLASLTSRPDHDERLSTHWQALKGVDAGGFRERLDRFVADPTPEQGMVLLSDVVARTLYEIECSRQAEGACA